MCTEAGLGCHSDDVSVPKGLDFRFYPACSTSSSHFLFLVTYCFFLSLTSVEHFWFGTGHLSFQIFKNICSLRNIEEKKKNNTHTHTKKQHLTICIGVFNCLFVSPSMCIRFLQPPVSSCNVERLLYSKFGSETTPQQLCSLGSHEVFLQMELGAAIRLSPSATACSGPKGSSMVCFLCTWSPCRGVVSNNVLCCWQHQSSLVRFGYRRKGAKLQKS